MVVTYCTAADVASLVNIIDPEDDSRLVFTTSTFPKLAEVEQFINDAEDEIDQYIQHAYRSKSVSGEYHTLEGERYHNALKWINGVYVLVVQLEHREITTPVSGTDLFEFFNGDTWEDLIADYTKGDGSSEGDFWIDEELGAVYFLGVFPTIGRRNTRFTYRYGASSVPNDIRRACANLAASTIVASDVYFRAFPDNTPRWSFQTWADKFQTKAYKLLDKRREFILL